MAHSSGTRRRIGRVFVLDDERLLALAISRFLGGDHYVEFETDPRTAIERLVAQRTFDVVLCDIQMPRMGGPQVYAELLERAPAIAARIVFMTGAPDEPPVRAFLDSVPNAWISKPFDTESLRALVDRRSGGLVSTA